MALLYRLVKLPDRAQTHVFTFVVTKSVTRDPDRDVTSKEFACGHQKWSITFSRTDKMLGAYLVWKSASESVRVYVDFTFTILNREHFSVNESFAGKQVSDTTLPYPPPYPFIVLLHSDLVTRCTRAFSHNVDFSSKTVLKCKPSIYLDIFCLFLNLP